MGEVYEITKELVNTNTKADPPVLDPNGNMLSSDEEKLNRWREENTLSLLCRVKFPLLLQPQKLFHQRVASSNKSENSQCHQIVFLW